MKKTFLFILLVSVYFISCEKKDEPKQEEEIVKEDPILSWEDPADIYYETLLTNIQLNATANVPGYFTYSPNLNTKLSVGANQLLQVHFNPTDYVHYNTVNKTVKINVLAKKNPVITWAKPEQIYCGTKLTSLQLNATADVNGRFVYSPDFGRILLAGINRKLTVTFYPKDSVQYNVKSVTVGIDILWYPIEFNSSLTYGTMTDQDGNTYKTITIGSQTWMAENLRTTKYRNGDPITNITDLDIWRSCTEGAYCWMTNDEQANKEIMGALYNWNAVMDSRNIAPEGWHVPTESDWSEMIYYIGGWSVAGGKLKEVGTKHWTSPNEGATNSTGFTALACGYIEAGGSFIGFGGASYSTLYWSPREFDTEDAWGYYIDCSNSYIALYHSDKKTGHPVRLVKD